VITIATKLLLFQPHHIFFTRHSQKADPVEHEFRSASRILSALSSLSESEI
jgi:hypothetical protein